MKGIGGLLVLALAFTFTSCVTYRWDPLAPISAQRGGVTVDAFAVMSNTLRFDVTVTNRSGHTVLVDSDDFQVFTSDDNATWRVLPTIRSAEVYRRAREAAASEATIVAVEPAYPVYETTTIVGDGAVTTIRRRPVYHEYILVRPQPDEQLADFRSSLFYSAAIDDGRSKGGLVFAQPTHARYIKLVVPIEGQSFEITYQRVKD